MYNVVVFLHAQLHWCFIVRSSLPPSSFPCSREVYWSRFWPQYCSTTTSLRPTFDHLREVIQKKRISFGCFSSGGGVQYHSKNVEALLFYTCKWFLIQGKKGWNPLQKIWGSAAVAIHMQQLPQGGQKQGGRVGKFREKKNIGWQPYVKNLFLNRVVLSSLS